LAAPLRIKYSPFDEDYMLKTINLAFIVLGKNIKRGVKKTMLLLSPDTASSLVALPSAGK
jgi:hypothetical protein